MTGADADFRPPGRAARRLVAEYPELERSVPWIRLAHAPTPVEPASGAFDYLGRDRVWIKRDDLVSPLFGGNKVRRFEYLLADAQARGARTIVTVGGLASTQVMATALFGRALGFDVTAVLFDQPLTTFARTALLTVASVGARAVRGGGYVTTAWRTLRELRRADRPYFIWPGASNAMATLGYVDAMLELGDQVDAGLLPRPDLIVLPTGSGGTLAGLALGAAMLGWRGTVIVGVRITELVACNRLTLRWLVESTARYLAKKTPRFSRRRLGPVRFGLYHGAIGRGYGYPTPEAIEARAEVEHLTGVQGEVTYSGKALVGLRAIGRAHPDASILYWHTLSSARLDLAGVEPAALGPEFAGLFEGDLEV